MLPVTARDFSEVSRVRGEKSAIDLKFSISSNCRSESAASGSIDAIFVELPNLR